MMRKIIVGFDVSPLYSAHRVRGVGFYTKRLLKSLKKNRDSKIKILELKSQEEIESGKYDLLHIPYFHPYFFTLPFRKSRPLVVTIHDLIPVKYLQHYPPGIKGRIRWEIQKRLLQRVDLVIADSFASRDDIVKLAGYPQNRVHVVYLAADEAFGKIRDSKRLKRVGKKYKLPEKFVLYVGDINWNKNIPGLVKACQRISIPLVIVGKQAKSLDFDPHHPENKDLVWLKKVCSDDSNHRSEIKLLGFVPTVDLVAIYNLATVYCQPSFDEGFGLPVLEAMSCGCPVVCSNRGSLPEVVDEAGMLVDPSVKSLAEGIERMLKQDSLRKKYSLLGFKRSKKFSWRKTARKTSLIYRRVCLDY